ncbi:MAG: glycerophosphodiester phosphodiesterase [Bacillus sp. (in: firmicutes)]
MKYCWAAAVFTFLFLGGCVHQQHQSEEVRTESVIDSFVVISHRGASAYAPEHTIPAYEAALKLGADYLEIDLQMTKDGHLIALHDDTVDRTTDGTGYALSMSLAEIKQLNAGTWFNKSYEDYADSRFESARIPTLDEILEHFGKDANYYIEMKGTGMEKKLLRLLDKHGMLDKHLPRGKVVIQSFNKESLKKMHDLNAAIPLIQLLSYKEPAAISASELMEWRSYATGIAPNYDMIDKKYVVQARAAGLLVHPYTVNHPEDMARLIEYGITGAFTNVTDQLIEASKEWDGSVIKE